MKKYLYLILLVVLSFNVFAKKASYNDLMRAFSDNYVFVDTGRTQACFSLFNGDIQVITKSSKCDEVKKIFISHRGALCITTRSNEDCRKVRILTNGGYAFGGAKRPITIYDSEHELLGKRRLDKERKMKQEGSRLEDNGQSPWVFPETLKSIMIEACEKEAHIRPNNNLSDRGIKTRDFCNCIPNKTPKFFKSFDDFILTSQDKQKSEIISLRVASQCVLELMSSTDVKESNKVSSSDQQKPLVKSVTGSGFFITSEELVTNHHVVNNCKSIFVNINNENISASVIAHSKEKDIAILRVDDAVQSCNVATLRDGKGIKTGDDVIVIGHPLGDLLGSGLKVTKGNVSALFGVHGDMDRMQITAPVQGGNSGGPLFDSSGNVVGVVTDKLDVLKINKMMNDLPQNVNFAVKSSVLRGFLDVNNIAYSARQSDHILKTSDIVQRAEQFTVKVICNRN